MRIVILAVAFFLTFGAIVLIGLQVLPKPHSEVDYLVIGSTATFVSLAVVFFAVIKTLIRTADNFYRRRSKAKPEEAPEEKTES